MASIREPVQTIFCAVGKPHPFPTIEKLADALEIDPAALFILDPVPGRDMRRPLIELTATLAALSDRDLAWVAELLTSALKARR